MAVAGLASVIWPAPSVSRAAAYGLAYIWAVFLALGGSTAAVGAATDRWLGEYIGLPLLTTTFGIYGLAAATAGRVTSIAGAAALTSIALLLAARWRDVAIVRREADRYADRRAR